MNWIEKAAAASEALKRAATAEEEPDEPKQRRPRSEWGSGAAHPRTVCVCRLLNKANGRALVAKTTDLYNYGLLLFSRLRRNKHRNAELQRDFNEFGVDAFALQVLQGCAERMLEDVYNDWVRRLDAYNPMFGYNRTPRAYLASPEERAARAARQEEHWRNVKASKERRAARAARRQAKLARRALNFDQIPNRMSDRAAREAAKRPAPPPPAPKRVTPEDQARQWAREQGLDWDRLVTG